MKSADQAGSGGDWRMQLREMRTRDGLRAPEPALDDVRRLSDRELRAAAQNPDHSEAGRAAAEAELRARNVSTDRWRLSVPGFIRAKDLEKGERLFFGWGRNVRVWSGALVFWSLLAMFAVAFFEVRREEARLDSVGAEIARCIDTASCSTAELAELAGDSSAYPPVLAMLFAAVFGLSLLVWFAVTCLRRKPARMLLLRKFNKRELAEPLSRMLARELRPYGHVASLSDKFIRRDAIGGMQMGLLAIGNPLAAAWFVLGMPIRFIWRLFDRSAMGPAVVLNARDYRNLARRLRDRVGLNAQVALVSKEALLVRTSDAWWRMVVGLLADSSDAIIVDLSQVSAGTAWELDLIREEGSEARCVFVSIWGKLDEAEAALAARGIASPVFHYAPDGEMQRRDQFRAAMLAAMRATHRVPA